MKRMPGGLGDTHLALHCRAQTCKLQHVIRARPKLVAYCCDLADHSSVGSRVAAIYASSFQSRAGQPARPEATLV